MTLHEEDAFQKLLEKVSLAPIWLKSTGHNAVCLNGVALGARRWQGGFQGFVAHLIL